MKPLIILIALLFSTLPDANAYAQAKVGTSSPFLIDTSPSTRINGLADAGVSLVSPMSYSINPGSLGLFTNETKLSLVFIPKNKLYDNDNGNGVVLLGSSYGWKLNRSNDSGALTLATAYYYHRLNTGDFTERTYARGTVQVGRTFTSHALTHNASFAIGFIRNWKVGIGGTLRYYQSSVNDYSTSALMGNIGIIIQPPQIVYEEDSSPKWLMTISYGVSLQNIGADIKYIARRVPLGQRYRVGFSTTLERQKNHRVLYSLTSIIELEKLAQTRTNYSHLALEASLFNIVTLRAGHERGGGYEALTTYGFTLSSKGLATFLHQRSDNSKDTNSQSFWSRVDLRIEFAKYSKEFLNSYDFFGFSALLLR